MRKYVINSCKETDLSIWDDVDSGHRDTCMADQYRCSRFRKLYHTLLNRWMQQTDSPFRHLGPCLPGGQLQAPVTGWQSASSPQSHLLAQPLPNRPGPHSKTCQFDTMSRWRPSPRLSNSINQLRTITITIYGCYNWINFSHQFHLKSWRRVTKKKKNTCLLYLYIQRTHTYQLINTCQFIRLETSIDDCICGWLDIS